MPLILEREIVSLTSASLMAVLRQETRDRRALSKVEYEATAELVKRFFLHMVQEGKPAAAAPREAQVEVWQEIPWRSPYYWPAFILQGEWK